MKILGLCASFRPWGNTEILVQNALRGAASQGAETRFLRLTDLALRPCTGCMVCFFKGRDCPLEDGFPRILEAFRWADGVVLGSPAYVLGATGVLKTLQDRMIRFGMTRELAGRPGIAVAAAGVQGWEPFALPQIALTFLFLGMPVLDQFVGYAQGPGEILDDAACLERALAAGSAMARGETSFRGAPGGCPVCHFDLVTVGPDGAGRCPLCDLPGRWHAEEGQLRFQADPCAEPRWSEAVRHRHFQEKILPSGPRFKSRMRELRAKLKDIRGRGS